MTLDEWVDKNASLFRRDFELHMKHVTSMPDDEKEDLMRMTLITLREWARERDGAFSVASNKKEE